MTIQEDFIKKERLQKAKIEEIKKLQEENIAQNFAQKLNLPYINLFITPINIEALKIVDEQEARAANLAVIQKRDRNLQIVVLDPQNPKTQKIIKDLKKQDYLTEIFIGSMRSLLKAWNYYKFVEAKEKTITGQTEVSAEKLKEIQKEIKTADDLKKKIESIPQKQASSVLEVILAGSLALDASDIHIEPQEENVKLRLRLDGLLYTTAFFDFQFYKLLLSRIKLLSGLKINVHDIAQDGRFTITTAEVNIEVRVSILPGAWGENIVMRILNPKAISISIEDLGLQEHNYKIIIKELERPNGMIINTGPTGSGKTTTLYAFLKKLNTPDVKIITLEDPIEYHLPGISQTQIESEKGYTFAAGLRAILRQDPDIILVGEMRDLETITTALNAALTGHLVFSTLHTNDAAGAIPRLIDSGANPAIIAPAINMIIAQRLVRRLCKYCSIKRKIKAEELEKLKETLKSLPKNIKIPKLNEDLEIYEPKGCEKCNNLGYKGRIGIFEIFVVDEDAEKVILKSPSESELKDLLKKKGMVTMKQDGFLQVLKGVTTIEEVERITG